MDKGEEEEDLSELFKDIMEGYSDKVIPLLSDLITENNNKNINDENVSADQMVETCFSRKEKKSILVQAEVSHQSLVPMEIIQKTSKKKEIADIIEETVKYINKLEEELKELEESKKKKTKKELSKTSINSLNSSIVDVTVTGNTAFFGIQVEKTNNNVEEPFLVSRVMKVFEYFKTEILTITVTTRNELKTKKMITSYSTKDELGIDFSSEVLCY
ncbi:hypothetical protein MKX01_040081 [Papaver californicum]|nr:hypothetical protein MKX01_040081 [Papaver californicum]